jgi:hypothetical protein
VFEKFVRLPALLLAFAFLLIFYTRRANGRFQMHSVGGSPFILDTRTGDVYQPIRGKWTKMDRRMRGEDITVDPSEVTPVEHKNDTIAVDPSEVAPVDHK